MKFICFANVIFSLAVWSVVRADNPPATQPAPVAEIQPDGSILLKPDGARVHGFRLKVVHKPEIVLAYWVDQNEYPEWPKAAARKGKYAIEITYSCPQRAGGDFSVVAAANRVNGTTHNTADWHTFTTQKLDDLTVLNDNTTISVRCNRLDHALMNVQQIKLTPVEEKVKK